MKTIRRLIVPLALLSIFVAVPAFAVESGPGDGSCKRCFTYSDDTTAAAVCVHPDDGETGNTDCKIQCYVAPEFAYCVCRENGDWCMYIEVQSY